MRPATMEIVARTLAEGESALLTGATVSQPPRALPVRPSRPSVGMSLSPSTAATNVSTETGPSIAPLPPTDDRTRRSAQPRATRAILASRVTPIAIGSALLLAAVGFVGVRATHVRGVASSSSSEASKPTFRLVVESTPPGAEVVEGDVDADVVLGTTPLTLAIDNAVARTQPRKLTLRLAGYQPYALTQGPSDDNVRILATLILTPAPAAAPLATLTPPNDAPPTSAQTAHAARASAPAPHPRSDSPAESAARKPDQMPEQMPDPKPDPKPEQKAEQKAEQKPEQKPDPRLDIRLSR